jgi:hypothetical protein
MKGQRLKARVGILAFALWGLALLGWADEQVVPQGVVVSPPKSQLNVEIWTEFQLYSPGEAVRIHLRLSRDAYVYVYDIAPDGEVTLLFPNGFSRNNFLRAGEHVLPEVPDYSFVVEETLGTETLQVLALARPIPLLTLSVQSLDEAPFPEFAVQAEKLKPQVEQLIQIAVAPDEWAADWTQFVVVPAVSHLFIDTEPQGAQVFLDGELRGRSPLQLDLPPGRVRVRIVKEGYAPWSRTLTLPNRTFRELHVRLVPPSPSVPAPFPTPEEDGGQVIFLGPLALGLNAGLNDQGVFSVGLELGRVAGARLGISVSLTQDEGIPKYHEIPGPAEFERERVYDLGPETELYVKLAWPAVGAFYLELGAGIAIQEKVHIARPSGVIEVSSVSTAAEPLVEILPNGYRETEGHLTGLAGLALQAGNSLLSVSFHTRRGLVLGVALKF